MVRSELVLTCLLPPLDTPVFSRFDCGGEAPWCPPRSSILLYSTKRFDDVVEGMVIRGLILEFPVAPLVILLYLFVLTAEWTGPVVPPPSLPLDTAEFSCVDGGEESPRGSGTLVPPSCLLILLHCLL